MPRNITREQRKAQIGPISATTIRYRIGEWVRNVVANEFTIRNSKGITYLYHKMKNIPTILVGAGPSLDKNIDLLAECYDKACIIACSSALKPMMEKGILPHIVFVTDSKPIEMKTMLEECDAYSRSKEMILVCDSFVHPSVHEGWEGELFFYNIQALESCPFTASLLEFTGQIGLLGAGGSVTTIMLCFAFGGLQSDPTIFVGQDCAYYDPKKHHVSNTASGVADLTKAYIPMDFVDYREQKCFTNKALLSFCYWFEDYCLANDGTFINATEGGILTNGVTMMTLRKTIDKHLTAKYNILELLLDEATIIEGAKPEKRWIFRTEDPKQKPEEIIQRSTYLPGQLMEHLIGQIDSQDFIGAICSHSGLMSSIIDPGSKDKQLLAFVKDTVQKTGISNIDLSEDEFRSEDFSSVNLDHADTVSRKDGQYDIVFAINKLVETEEADLMYIVAEAKRILKPLGIFIFFTQNKEAAFKAKDLFEDSSLVGIGFFSDSHYDLVDEESENKEAVGFGDYDAFAKKIIISGSSYAAIVTEDEADIFACMCKKLGYGEEIQATDNSNNTGESGQQEASQ